MPKTNRINLVKISVKFDLFLLYTLKMMSQFQTLLEEHTALVCQLWFHIPEL